MTSQTPGGRSILEIVRYCPHSEVDTLKVQKQRYSSLQISPVACSYRYFRERGPTFKIISFMAALSPTLKPVNTE